VITSELFSQVSSYNIGFAITFEQNFSISKRRDFFSELVLLNGHTSKGIHRLHSNIDICKSVRGANERL